jgi:nitrite reductase/ring-hydroxylating ferredoxin subunit
MSLLKTLLRGRPDGLRARFFRRSPPPAAPSASGSAPSGSRPAAPEAAEKALGLDFEAPKDVTPPDGYEVVLHKDALAEGAIIEIIIGGTAIAVARAVGKHYAIANTCPHAGGPLGDGKLDGTVVACPYHGWKFDVTTGACLTQPKECVRTYDVKVVGSAVCVQI